MSTNIFVVALVVLFANTSLYSQFYLKNTVNLVDKSTQKSVEISQPAATDAGIKLVFPTTQGAANQTLYVKSRTGTAPNLTAELDWSSITTAGSTQGGVALATETAAVVNATLPSLSIAIPRTNTTYRLNGTLWIRKTLGNNTNAPGSDLLRLRLSVPSGSTEAYFAVRCVNCAATTTIGGTTTLSTFSSTLSSNTVTTGDIDPSGTGAAAATYYAYFVEGIVVTGSTSGNIALQLLDQTTPPNTTDRIWLRNLSSFIIREVK